MSPLEEFDKPEGDGEVEPVGYRSPKPVAIREIGIEHDRRLRRLEKAAAHLLRIVADQHVKIERHGREMHDTNRVIRDVTTYLSDAVVALTDEPAHKPATPSTPVETGSIRGGDDKSKTGPVDDKPTPRKTGAGGENTARQARTDDRIATETPDPEADERSSRNKRRKWI